MKTPDKKPQKPAEEPVFINERPPFEDMFKPDLVAWIEAVGAQLVEARVITAEGVQMALKYESLVIAAKALFYVAEGNKIILSSR